MKFIIIMILSHCTFGCNWQKQTTYQLEHEFGCRWATPVWQLIMHIRTATSSVYWLPLTLPPLPTLYRHNRLYWCRLTIIIHSINQCVYFRLKPV